VKWPCVFFLRPTKWHFWSVLAFVPEPFYLHLTPLKGQRPTHHRAFSGVEGGLQAKSEFHQREEREGKKSFDSQKIDSPLLRIPKNNSDRVDHYMAVALRQYLPIH